MKKVLNKNTLFGIIIGIVIMGGISVLALNYLYKSEDVLYKKSDNTDVSVKTALEELYGKIDSSGNNVALLFTTSPVDMKKYTDRWAELTISDFIIGFTSCSASVGTGSSGAYTNKCSTTSATSYNYNSTLGQLNFSANSGYAENYSNSENGVWVRTYPAGLFAVWKGTVAGVAQ